MAKKILQRFIKGYRNIYRKYQVESMKPPIEVKELPEKISVSKEKEIIQKVFQVQPQIESPTTIPIKITPVVTGEVQPQIESPTTIPIKITPVVTGEVQPKEEELEGERIKYVKQIEGAVEIPEIIVPAKVKPGKIEEEGARTLIQMAYPLIPKKPKPNEPIFAYAKIYWDNKSRRYVYEVVEPKLSEKLKQIIGKIKDLLEQRLDIDFSRLKKIEASEYLHKQIMDIINYFGFKLTDTEKAILRYYVERDFMGLGKIEPLMQDDQIEDISCDGYDIPIFVFHRNPHLGTLITNIKFSDPDELDSFIIKLAQIAGKSISVAEPLIDATLPDGSRLQATLATDIARKGSNFTIRKFTEQPLTPTDLLNFNTIDARTLAYLWLAVDYGRSVLVAGGTASGKTSFLNVLSLFIRPDKKIISIEDTAELQLPHEHWVPSVARTPVAGAESLVRGKEIDLFELLRESFRQRPDYIVVGEVRGREAFILFQQMATGHPSLATIHAENLPKLVDRLTTPPISLHPTLITNADLIVFLARMRYKEKHVRKVVEVLELVGYDSEKNMPIVNQVFKWDPISDKFVSASKSFILKKISDLTGLKKEDLVEELKRRTVLLNWMQERNITNYTDVFKVLSEYYSNPEAVMARILGEV
ncbi:MAG: type II/IV secretion system ATPase subunit [Candidatus Aenigmatarchaeota archaeon]